MGEEKGEWAKDEESNLERTIKKGAKAPFSFDNIVILNIKAE